MTKTLIRGGTIVSMDPTIGDLPQGDVLIDGERIAAIAPHIQADDAQVVDASGTIVIPGLVNAHMHTWQTGLRGVADRVVCLPGGQVWFVELKAPRGRLSELQKLFAADMARLKQPYVVLWSKEMVDEWAKARRLGQAPEN